MKPILFTTEMVRAILDGRKTVTRRVFKDAALHISCDCNAAFYMDIANGVFYCDRCGYPLFKDAPVFTKPPYRKGDILYVRETWDALPVLPDGKFLGGSVYYYKADGDLRPVGWQRGWHPSIHMPRKIARIFLRVTEVRAERLCDVTEADAIAEGVKVGMGGKPYFSCRDAFNLIWDSTIKPADRDRYGWDANPYVWRIAFKRCEKPE